MIPSPNIKPPILQKSTLFSNLVHKYLVINITVFLPFQLALMPLSMDIAR